MMAAQSPTPAMRKTHAVSRLELPDFERIAPTFIDLFAGCGGLSLGLLKAGWHGLWAVEQNQDAFRTLRHNLIDGVPAINRPPRFAWPSWLPIVPMEITDFLATHEKMLRNLRGQISLVAGGPPCQGFSFAGRRRTGDPRNELFRSHIKLVDILQPDFVLLENVAGISVAFGKTGWIKKGRKGNLRRSYAEEIYSMLEEHGYKPRQKLVWACDFGVPQLRPRYITIAIRNDLVNKHPDLDVFQNLEAYRQPFLGAKGLGTGVVTVKQAISDLRKRGHRKIPCQDSLPGYIEISYDGPETPYQKLMHRGMNGHRVNSLRLANHRKETIDKFRLIQKQCRKGVQLSPEDRKAHGISKHQIVPLAGNRPSHTLTTLPDDLLHYSEPRIHTVREYARLQSFPDWFEFKGNYTTGGDRRKRECPRYSQVGNAVSPLLAEAIGQVLRQLWWDFETDQ